MQATYPLYFSPGIAENIWEEYKGEIIPTPDIKILKTPVN